MTQVRDLAAGDRAAWQELYAGYGDFYETPLTEEKAELVFGWLLADDNESFCLVATDDNARVIGIAHYREFSRPLAGGRGLYLDDLFTASDARGTGTASALIARLREIAVERGIRKIRWITAEDNTTAQRLYDTLATRTTWVTYDMDLDAN
ncbi:GNAT family N-acetyltransferase [Glaciihabitans sp. dw_435]|uniref:GNAT family N-acetyltransferase n=1 Tax=Glaciihabitans sp. dw_435 TaxID=2720081 RepID=UPI001BD67E66|nr:GNAT family N-acetyltransferase [Glaciihabitans sp. dw_435]